MKIAYVFGTRPEIIKLAELIKITYKTENVILIHSGQHYSYNLSKIFLDDFNLPKIDYNLKIGSGSHSFQTGKAMIKLEKVFLKEKPDIVIVEGDTNTVLAGALASVKNHILLGHVESGIRSFDRKMPEEINRILTDKISDFCFAPTTIAVDNLLNEGFNGSNIFLTGNTIVDAVKRYFKPKEKEYDNYALLTLHRPENVDNPKILKEILNAVQQIKDELNIEIICPLHPRTSKNIKNLKFEKLIKNFEIMNPLGYFEFLNILSHARIVITDSGGVQEESCILNIPCVTTRTTTERPETLGLSNCLVGVNKDTIVKGIKYMIRINRNWKHPYGNDVSAKIYNILKSKIYS